VCAEEIERENSHENYDLMNLKYHKRCTLLFPHQLETKIFIGHIIGNCTYSAESAKKPFKKCKMELKWIENPTTSLLLSA